MTSTGTAMGDKTKQKCTDSERLHQSDVNVLSITFTM